MGKGLGLCLAIVLAAAAAAQSGWSRYRVRLQTPSQAQRLTDSNLPLFSDNVQLGDTDVIVGPGQLVELAKLNLPSWWVSNLPDPRNWQARIGMLADDYQLNYLRYDAIIAKYEGWRLANSNWITRQAIGTTWNGRTLWAYRFYAQLPGGAVRVPKRSVVINCGIHAREWISPAVGMYLFDQLIQSYRTRSEFASRIPRGTAFYFIPVLNVDGYEFCWTDDRYWRKNRRSNGSNRWGVDLNRNFSEGWGGQGSSSNPSSDTYRGPAAFSEPESTALRNYVDTIEPVAGFIDFHSYGQYILWPWGYKTALCPGDPWLRSLGLKMKAAIQGAGGLSYTAGPSASTLYVASGVTPDYFYARFNAAAYTIELRDTGQFGFVLPESQILPTQVEAWPAFQELAAHLTIR